MGFFSWLTSDTGESIKNIHTGKCRTVYLLQPNGEPPIEESEYEGYGEFGGVDAYVWLAKMNLPADRVRHFNEETLRSIGIEIGVGSVLRHKETGQVLSVFHDARPLLESFGLSAYHFGGAYDVPIPAFEKSANQLQADGLVERVQISQLVEIRYPLKFSFDRDAKYEDLPPAKNDPSQGCFEEDEPEDEEPGSSSERMR